MSNPPVTFDTEKFDFWLRSNPGFSQAALRAREPLSQDGSGRIFWRVLLGGVRQERYVYIEHPLVGGPVFEGDAMPQAQAFIEAARVLRDFKIPAPQVYASWAPEGRILMEDIGETSLASMFDNPPGEIREHLEENFKSDWLERLFEQALDLTKEVQSIPFDIRFVGFRRYRSIDFLRAEINEFVDHYAEGKNIRPAARTELKKTFDSICEELFSFPKTLSLFDYNCFNLFLDLDKLENEQPNILRILDFQDVSLSSPVRDIFSLLNDRGIDEMLGQERQGRLLKYYIAKREMNDVQRADFLKQYYTTALHWDFRVVGRFNKLNANLGTDRYTQWIAPTLRRLGRMLVINQKLLPGVGDALDIVRNLSPEAKEGSQEDWTLR